MSTLGERIRLARGKTSQDAFSRSLKISKGSLGFYERNENLPNTDVVLKICSETGVGLVWLLTGIGDMRPNHTSEAVVNPQETAPQAECTRCSKLENKLEKAESQRDELAVENRQLHRDKEALLRENGELREKVARLEERKRRYEITHGLYVEDDSRV